MKKRVYFSLLAGIMLLAILAFRWGGAKVVDLIDRGIQDGVASMGGASMSIGFIDGNPFSGYRITSLRLMDRSGVTVATVRSVTGKPDLKALLSGRIRLASLEVEGVRVEEMLLPDLVSETESGGGEVPLEIGLVTVSDCGPLYGGGWSLTELRAVGDGMSWSGYVRGSWREEPLDGDFEFDLSEGVRIPAASIRGVGGSLSFSGSLSPGLDGSGSLEDLSMERLGAILPSLEGAGVKGRANLRYRLFGTFSSPVLSGDLHFSEGGLGELPLPDVMGDVSFSGGELSLSSCRIELGEGTLSGDISVGLISEDHPIQVDLVATDVDLSSFSGELRDKAVSLDVGFLSIALKGPAASPVGEMSFRKVRALKGGGGLTDMSGKVTIREDGGLDVLVRSPLAGGKLSVKGAVDLDGGSVDLSALADNVDLSELSSLTGNRLPDVEGKIGADIKVSGPLGAPSAEGRLFSDKLAVSGGSLGRTEGSFRYDKGLLRIISLSSAIGSGKVTGEGTVDLEKGPSIRIDGKLSGISGASLEKAFPAAGGNMPEGVLDGSWSYRSKGSGGLLNMDLRSGKLVFVEVFPFMNLEAKVSLEGERLKIDKVEAGLYGGRLSLSGAVPLAVGDMAVEGSLSGLDGSVLFGAMGGLDATGKIDGEFSLSGSYSSPRLDFSARTDRLDLESLPLEKLSLSLKSGKDRIDASLKGLMGGFPLKGGGWVRLPSGKDVGALDLEASVRRLDIRSIMPKDIEMGGTLFGKIHLLGPLDKPKLYAQGKAPRVQVGNMTFASVDLGGFLGRDDDLSFQASSLFGDRRVQASCDVKPYDSGWGLEFDASGGDVLLSSLAPNLEGVVDGRVDLNMSGSWKDGKVSASGNASSRELSTHGVKIRSVSLPLKVDGPSLKVSGGKAEMYGGRGDVDLSVDLTRNSWKGKVEVKGIDVKPLLEDGADLPGTISGDADLKLDLSGVAGRAFLFNVTGFLRGRSVELIDFSVLKSVTKGAPLRVKDLAASFNIDGQELYILPGSRASAWPGDDFYRYLDVSGSAWRSESNSMGDKRESLDLSCSGEVNLKALNALLGAMRSLLEATIENIKDPRSLATDLLAGIVGGYSAKDFREISLHVGGGWDSPVISDLKIGEKGGLGGLGTGLPTNGKGGETKIRIQIDIPTGEGGGEETDAGDQVKQQILENLLKQVIGDQDTTE